MLFYTERYTSKSTKDIQCVLASSSYGFDGMKHQ